MDTNTHSHPPFWVAYLRIMGIDTLIVFALAWLLGGLQQVSNLYFWSTAVLFLIAAFPVFGEMGGSVRTVYRLSKGEKMADLKHAQEAAAQKGWRITALYGLSGVSTFVLSVLTSFWWQI
ncbi:MAG: hypothetical protein D6755_01395 [Anaerolineae bacterium]|nr:MAG: hypothetical protein D6755_01395 [Anaerolineae bacterium]